MCLLQCWGGIPGAFIVFGKASTFFWKELLSWIAVEANIVLNASLLDILFGKFDLENDFLLVNHILLLAKYFIYKCKLSKVIPSLLVFKAKLKATYKVELYIAKEKRILPNHYKKWDNFLSWLSWCLTYMYVYACVCVCTSYVHTQCVSFILFPYQLSTPTPNIKLVSWMLYSLALNTYFKFI